MINYTIKVNMMSNGKRRYLPVIEESRYQVLVYLLFLEVRMFKDDILDVLTGNSEDNYFGGNCCYFEVNDGMATVEGLIDGADMGDPVTVPVDELLDLINRWEADLARLKKEC